MLWARAVVALALVEVTGLDVSIQTKVDLIGGCLTPLKLDLTVP